MGFLRVRAGTGRSFQAESVFRVELPGHDTDGEPLRYGQQFRLVHARSDACLAALNQEQCALVEAARDAPQCQ
eukprot:619288-Prymnesium_polylepis.1